MTTAKDFIRFAPGLQKRLREIAIPIDDNAHRSYAVERGRFEVELSRITSGYTRMAVSEGFWRDPETNTIYQDRVAIYRIGCNAEEFGRVLSLAFDFFPDQKAFFVADVGTFDVIERFQKDAVST